MTRHCPLHNPKSCGLQEQCLQKLVQDLDALILEGLMPSSSYKANVESFFADDSSYEIPGGGSALLYVLQSYVESIVNGDHQGRASLLPKLADIASPRGHYLQRVVAYFTEALTLGLQGEWPPLFSVNAPKSLTDPTEDEDEFAMKALDGFSPIPKFLYQTANERLLRAFQGQNRVHIIDLDIKDGRQWIDLFNSFRHRPNPPSRVKITAIGRSLEQIVDAGVELESLANSLNLDFKYHFIEGELTELTGQQLQVRSGELLAVNCALKMHEVLDDDLVEGRVRVLLSLIRKKRPAIFVLAEQDSDHSAPTWQTRFANSLTYYTAIFNSLDSGLRREDPTRIKIEEMFAREIRNIIACEGSERIARHQNFDQWKDLMEDNGFICAGMGEVELSQSEHVISLFRRYEGRFSVERRRDRGGITLNYLGNPLYTVSAWTVD